MLAQKRKKGRGFAKDVVQIGDDSRAPLKRRIKSKVPEKGLPFRGAERDLEMTNTGKEGKDRWCLGDVLREKAIDGFQIREYGWVPRVRR